MVACSSKFEPKQGGYSGGYDEKGKRRPDGFMHYTITLKITEVIKGDVPATITIKVQTMADDKRFEGWAKAKTEFLWLTGEPTMFKATHEKLGTLGAIQLGAAVPEQEFFGAAFPVLSMDFGKVALDNAQVLDRVHRWAKHPLPVKTERIDLGYVAGYVTTLTVLKCRNADCCKKLRA